TKLCINIVWLKLKVFGMNFILPDYSSLPLVIRTRLFQHTVWMYPLQTVKLRYCLQWIHPNSMLEKARTDYSSLPLVIRTRLFQHTVWMYPLQTVSQLYRLPFLLSLQVSIQRYFCRPLHTHNLFLQNALQKLLVIA